MSIRFQRMRNRFQSNLVPRVSLLPAPWSERGGKKRDPGNEVDFSHKTEFEELKGLVGLCTSNRLCREAGAKLCRHLKVSELILNIILCSTGSQWRCCKAGLMCQYSLIILLYKFYLIVFVLPVLCSFLLQFTNT